MHKTITLMDNRNHAILRRWATARRRSLARKNGWPNSHTNTPGYLRSMDDHDDINEPTAWKRFFEIFDESQFAGA